MVKVIGGVKTSAKLANLVQSAIFDAPTFPAEKREPNTAMPKAIPPPTYRHPLLEQCRSTLTQTLCLNPSVPVAVALSGGADSVALLRALLFLGFSPTALHVNFHLRGEESNADEIFVRTLCKELSVPLEVREWDTPAYARQRRLSTEMAARELRYSFFDEWGKRYPNGYVALGHHREDNMETLLAHLAKGTGLKGLRAIPPKRGIYIRPLIDVPKDDIITFLSLLAQPFCSDTTNEDTSIERNYIRHELLPRFAQINPSYAEGIQRTIENLREEERLYLYAVEEWLRKAHVDCPSSRDQRILAPGDLLYNARTLAESPAPLTLLLALLGQYGFRRIDLVTFSKNLRHSEPAQIESPSHTVRRQAGKLVIHKK